LIAAKFGIGQSRFLLNNTPDTVSLVGGVGTGVRSGSDPTASVGV
jgi:hypothetical protein